LDAHSKPRLDLVIDVMATQRRPALAAASAQLAALSHAEGWGRFSTCVTGLAPVHPGQ
jgi:hypothetical protein